MYDLLSWTTIKYLGQKKYHELIQMLYNGSLLLLQCEQYTSGADLGILLIDVFKKAEIKPTHSYFQKMIDLFTLMNPVCPERETFVQNALRWSMTGSTYKTGHPDFHRKLAQVYWQEKNYPLARQHYLYTKDGFGCASMLIELHQKHGYSNEIDFFITQTVLQYLCLQNAEAAEEAFTSFINQHPKIAKQPPFILPLLNFSFFLLKTIQFGKISMFTILCDQYFTSLSRDPCFLQYLEKIGQIFFDVQPSQIYSRRGLFSSFLQSFFNDINEEENSDDQQRINTKSIISAEVD
ncbi:UPF0363 protein CG9853 homolog isoform X2 [Nasonia vitripennis]|uniref:Golgi to ER traffic protein 4 homolog n=1 Tax=Nasonia vitripennis TaxID=7425 RepID=A0A7M7TEB9_NASVI|nr:UPF0363 protein CG9853 homolog isoform X2 [Nasonia vitripennis]XP_032457289.1 UPF0363 protein CG9853 homolog isoform X2 [Nasonia vitripennis]